MGKRKNGKSGFKDEEIEETDADVEDDKPSNLSRSQIKTIVDEARYGGVCSTAKGYIDELDKEYDDEPPKKRKGKQEPSFLGSIMKFFSG